MIPKVEHARAGDVYLATSNGMVFVTTVDFSKSDKQIEVDLDIVFTTSQSSSKTPSGAAVKRDGDTWTETGMFSFRNERMINKE